MKKYIFLIIATALVTLTNCKGFLEEAPKLSQSDVLTLSTIEGLDKCVAGAYAPLASSSWYGSDWILYNEMKTSNGKKYIGTSYDSGRLNDYYNVSYTPTSTSGVYSAAYYIISAVNNVIDNIEGKGTEAQRNNLIAECLFLRALCHFDAVLTYAQPYNYTADASHAGIPVVLHTDAAARPSRATVKEVYDQVEADLLEAEKLINPSYSRSATDSKAVVSLPVIQALLSRVYLYRGNWQGAADYATKVIDAKDANGKPLYEMWTPEDLVEAKCYRQDIGTKEVIFEVYATTGNLYDPNGAHVGLFSMTTPSGYGDGGCSSEIVSKFEIGETAADTDARLNLFAATEDGCIFTMKYSGKGQYSTDDPVNTIVIRLSEMYLNRAEAGVNGATGCNPIADLKVIADNRNATPQPATTTGVAAEREKELCWEGHLWFDLGRTKQPMERTDVAAPNIVKSIPVGDYRWAMPIPYHEINSNPNITQNPGYSGAEE